MECILHKKATKRQVVSSIEVSKDAPTLAVSSIKTPVQDQLKSSISDLSNEIVYLLNKKSSGFASDDELKRLKQLQQDVVQQKKELKSKVDNHARQQRKRQNDHLITILTRNSRDIAYNDSPAPHS